MMETFHNWWSSNSATIIHCFLLLGLLLWWQSLGCQLFSSPGLQSLLVMKTSPSQGGDSLQQQNLSWQRDVCLLQWRGFSHVENKP